MYKVLGDVLLIAAFQYPPRSHAWERHGRPARTEGTDVARRRWHKVAGLKL